MEWFFLLVRVGMPSVSPYCLWTIIVIVYSIIVLIAFDHKLYSSVYLILGLCTFVFTIN